MIADNRKLIDQYLQNSLTGTDLNEFMDRLDSDQDFKNEVSFQNLLLEGMRDFEDNRLKSSIENYIGYKKPFIPSALKLILFFFFIAGLGIIIWNFSEQESTGSRNRYLSLDFLKSHKEANEHSGDILKSSDSPKQSLKSTKEKVQPVETGTNENYVSEDSSETNMESDPNIVVKKDQLLISFNLKPKLVTDEKQSGEKETSITDNTISSLNPSADLPQENKNNQEGYVVEFWVSPVNYKGYKLSKNKLILFGIDEPDAIELLVKNEKLILKYGRDSYLLEPSDDFGPFLSQTENPTRTR